MVLVVIVRPRVEYNCIQYVFAVRLLIPTEISTQLVSEIVILYIFVLEAYLEIGVFIASFCCVSKGGEILGVVHVL